MKTDYSTFLRESDQKIEDLDRQIFQEQDPAEAKKLKNCKQAQISRRNQRVRDEQQKI